MPYLLQKDGQDKTDQNLQTRRTTVTVRIFEKPSYVKSPKITQSTV